MIDRSKQIQYATRYISYDPTGLRIILPPVIAISPNADLFEEVISVEKDDYYASFTEATEFLSLSGFNRETFEWDWYAMGITPEEAAWLESKRQIILDHYDVMLVKPKFEGILKQLDNRKATIKIGDLHHIWIIRPGDKHGKTVCNLIPPQVDATRIWDIEFMMRKGMKKGWKMCRQCWPFAPREKQDND